MKTTAICIITLLLFLGFGCQKAKNSQIDPEKQEVRKAVKFAFGLEQQLWTHKSDFKSREQVYQHYRQGFSPGLSESLTSYSWSNGELRATEKTMEPPDTVHVLSISGDQATVFYKIPPDLRNIWQLKKYSIDNLQREGKRWIIYESNETDSVPPGIIFK